MSSQVIASHRENAEIYTGEALCKEKSRELLARMNLPSGLLPLDTMEEVGYNEGTGFVWLKQRKKTEHKFRSIGRNVIYDTEVTAFVEDRKMNKVTGVKSKELLIWISVSDIYVQDPPSSGKITFANSTGLSRTFPFAALEAED